MKVLLCETIRYNLGITIPTDEDDCHGLLMNIVGGSQFRDDKFALQLAAAKLLFDVEVFRPEELSGKKRLIRDLRSLTDRFQPIYCSDNTTSFIPSSELGLHDRYEYEQVLERITPTLTEIKNYPLVLSKEPYYSQQFLSHFDPKNPQCALAILATAGLQFKLPAIFCENNETIELVKEKFAEERLSYLEFLTDHLGQIHEHMLEPEINISELLDFTERNVLQQLDIKAQKFEAAIAKAGKNITSNLIEQAKNSVPVIAGNLMKGDFTAIAKSVLEILIGTLGSRKKAYEALQEKHPEAAYLYQIRSYQL